MTAALATIAFLATLWLLAFVAEIVMAESWAKIVAALKGQSILATAPQGRQLSWKAAPRVRSARPVHARPTLRAAA